MNAAQTGTSTVPSVIDCDLHNDLFSVDPLLPYLPNHWVAHFLQTEFKGPNDTYYPASMFLRDEEVLAGVGAPAGTSGGGEAATLSGSGGAPARPPGRATGRRPSRLTVEQVSAFLDRTGAEEGILACSYAIDSLHNPDQAVALATAVNDWQIAEWLERDRRLRGSIVVPIQIPSLAIEEIERVADHPGFAQVMLPVRSQHPYGSRLYHPLWQTLARHHLVAAIHFGGAPGNPPTPVGWPSYYFEEYVDMAGVFASQVTSMVVEGVFQVVPELRVTLCESGCTWLPSHMWRFNKDWKNLRSVTPWVKRAPSEYIREHVRLTMQPFDSPDNIAEVLKCVDRLGSEDMLLYSTDFPHRPISDFRDRIGAEMPAGLAAKILSGNARSWYRPAR